MNWLKTAIHRLFCRHDYSWLRNIYGDEIIYTGFKRSVWKCSKCGKYKYRHEYL